MGYYTTGDWIYTPCSSARRPGDHDAGKGIHIPTAQATPSAGRTKKAHLDKTYKRMLERSAGGGYQISQSQRTPGFLLGLKFLVGEPPTPSTTTLVPSPPGHTIALPVITKVKKQTSHDVRNLTNPSSG